jgi:hypothetical protein
MSLSLSSLSFSWAPTCTWMYVLVLPLVVFVVGIVMVAAERSLDLCVLGGEGGAPAYAR